MKKRCLIFWMTMLLVSALQGDSLHLVNGNTVHGILLEHNESEVRFQVEMGVLSFPISKVASVEYNLNGIEKLNALPDRKQEQTIKELQRNISTLYSHRATLQQRHHQIKQSQEKLRQIQNEMVDTNRALLGARQEMEAYARFEGLSVPIHLYLAYQRAAAEAERISTEHETKKLSMENIQGEIKEVQNIIQEIQESYFQKLRSYQSQLAGLENKGFRPEWTRKQRAMLSDLASIMIRQEIPLRREGNTLWVTARINGRIDAEFLLDTGCSDVLINATTTKLMALNADEIKGVTQIKIADGSLVDSQEILIRSIEIGSFKVENIRGHTPVEAKETRVPLLLGMGFLSHFHFTVDTKAKHLILERLR
jgi:clan AA aspartic protease (TIGR02281 family)